MNARALEDAGAGSPGGERALLIAAADQQLPAVLHLGEGAPRAAVLIIVGGPQYRVGSHRQFVLLARHLAARGCAVLRFDYGGMGDAGGDVRTFEDCSDHIRVALDRLAAEVPPGTRLLLWGLCDAASAIMMYAPGDARVGGVVVANPWARNPATQAGTMLRSYYLRRLLSADFWRKLLLGRVRVGESVGGLAKNVRDSGAAAEPSGFIERMRTGVERLRCPMLLIISERDLTAAEFLLTVERSKPWRKALAAAKLTRENVPGADHTFSRRSWRDAAADATMRWIDAS
jgi:exosortase A-associated hydrolase 1